MTTTTRGADDSVVRPFADWLREQSAGRTHEELSQGLHDLVARVRDTGKKGALTLTISVAPMKGDKDVLMLSDSVRSRLPEHDRKASIFYTDADGNLSRSDPSQMAFESLREVGADKPETGTTDRKEKRA